MSKKFANESELAERIVQWLENQHWEVYQEVQCDANGAIADIVAIQRGLVWVIEAKKSLGFAVLSQAHAWLPYAHFISVAVPQVKRSHREHRFLWETSRHYGIGVFHVNPNIHCVDFGVDTVINPRLNRRCGYKYITDSLTEHHKTFARAGNAEGQHWTPFQQTCREISTYVREHPGATLKELIANITTHYRCDSTARSCLAHWIRKGVVKGITATREGRRLKLFLKNEHEAQPGAARR